MTPQEEWKAIPEWEAFYEASSEGRIRGLDRVRANGRLHRGRILKPNISKAGYHSVLLTEGIHGETKRMLVHRAVLLTFVGAAPDGHVACHGDDDKSNNSIRNLRWDTPSENERDKVRLGNNHQTQKSKCPWGHPYTSDNLRAQGSSRAGHRGCKACHRASEYVRRRGLKMTQKIADLHVSVRR